MAMRFSKEDGFDFRDDHGENGLRKCAKVERPEGKKVNLGYGVT